MQPQKKGRAKHNSGRLSQIELSLNMAWVYLYHVEVHDPEMSRLLAPVACLRLLSHRVWLYV